ncbi:anti-sigma K factor RskA [Sphingomonas metalli]|uniref:Anti-sigma K factor RskA n=1 Tax=Sphingomonas metalli TaxID=1779358 RepID=A0A916SZN7_9SPHN|nr:anti-sigma factor [Sphingomonas metalli]GGB25342.1 anti-sigma K factor RskA [Sphingomonas metalli]
MTTKAPSSEPDVAAAELALGLLEGEERAAALRRVLAEPHFAAEVEDWRMRFAQLFDLWPEVAPPPELIERIDASLHGVAPAPRRRFPWPVLAIASSALAACLLVIVAQGGGIGGANAPVPPPVVVEPPAPLVAAIAGEQAAVAASFDPRSGALRLTAAPRVPAGRAAQLWAIGGDGVPHPLGLLAAQAVVLPLSPGDRVRLTPGVTLAISVEPPGGSPTGKPTGPVIATGALAAV